MRRTQMDHEETSSSSRRSRRKGGEREGEGNRGADHVDTVRSFPQQVTMDEKAKEGTQAFHFEPRMDDAHTLRSHETRSILPFP